MATSCSENRTVLEIVEGDDLNGIMNFKIFFIFLIKTVNYKKLKGRKKKTSYL